MELSVACLFLSPLSSVMPYAFAPLFPPSANALSFLCLQLFDVSFAAELFRL
jgi:hypothetical protein